MRRLIGLYIAIFVCISWYYVTQKISYGDTTERYTSYTFCALEFQNMPSLSSVWQPRVGAFYLAHWCLGWAKVTSLGDYANVFGLYNAGWLFATLLVIICFNQNPINIILATTAIIFCVLGTNFKFTIFPWDRPSMFFWTISFCLWRAKHFNWMLFVLIFGTLFKETVALTAVLIFFTDLPRNTQIKWFSAAFLWCLLIKVCITEFVLGSMAVYTIPATIPLLSWTNFWLNFGSLLLPVTNVWWLSMGFLLCFFVKSNTQYDKAVKTLIGLFILGYLQQGCCQEQYGKVEISKILYPFT